MSACPNTTAGGCRCPEHEPGLALHAADPVAYEAALARCRPTRLRVVTMPREQPCSGTMTCSCQACARDRGSLPQRDKPQPWEPKRSRRAA